MRPSGGYVGLRESGYLCEFKGAKTRGRVFQGVVSGFQRLAQIMKEGGDAGKSG